MYLMNMVTRALRKFINGFTTFLKKETVLFVATILAVISVFFVKPDNEYIGYIDYRVLCILLSFMIVMEGCKKIGVFTFIGNILIKDNVSVKRIALVLVLLCFFSSMFITNDVALLTFVPFTIMIFEQIGQKSLLMYVIVLQTIAANLGSILTPIGNPQNLYIYNTYNLSIGDFLSVMLPYWVISLVMVVLMTIIVTAKIQKSAAIKVEAGDIGNPKARETIFFAILFFMCILVVARLTDYRITFAAVFILVALFDYKILKNVDYCLILTFIAFFIFIGNIGRIGQIQEILSGIINGNEVIVGTISSQIVSNVPAALLLSGFTDNGKDLLVGVNIGGLGTLIASMASLISYKLYAHKFNDSKGKYLLVFTFLNIIFLMVLLFFYFVL